MKSPRASHAVVLGALLSLAYSCGGGGSVSSGTGGSSTGGSSGTGGTPITGAGSSTTSASAGTGGASSVASSGNTGGATSASSSGATTSSTSASSSASSGATTSSSNAASSSSGGTTAFVPKHVFTILLENHNYSDIVGSANAPYINGELIAKYGLATNYMDSGVHPSLPNYLYLISGDTVYNGFGLIDLDPDQTYSVLPPASFPVDADNLGNQLQVAGIKWRSYQESMGSPCLFPSPPAAANGHSFACKHDPFLYFANIQNGPNALCAKTNVDYSQFGADLAGGTYRYMWITPDLLDDGHDPSSDPATALKNSDTWLSVEVPKILASNAFADGGVLFITWDEGESGGDQVPMIVVTKGIKSPGYTSSVAYSHASYLATVEDIFGLPKLGAAANAPTMTEFWQ